MSYLDGADAGIFCGDKRCPGRRIYKGARAWEEPEQRPVLEKGPEPAPKTGRDRAPKSHPQRQARASVPEQPPEAGRFR